MSVYDVSGNVISSGGGADTGHKFPWLNIAHAGASIDKYGNSKYAFNRAHELGFDGVECDVRMTADNVVVMYHDGSITGTDAGGDSQTLTIASSNYADLAALTLYTIDGVDYHILRFDDFIRMAFNWKWIVMLDVKSASNSLACEIKCSEIIRDNGMSGKVIYMGYGFNAQTLASVLSNDQYANFGVDATADISTTVYADIPPERFWCSAKISEMTSATARKYNFFLWDVGSPRSLEAMEYRPNAIQWTGGTDGVSISQTYMDNLQWETTS